MKLLNASQLKALDEYSMNSESITSETLMERAGKALYNQLEYRIPELNKVIIFCGHGNNGGDGLVIARHFALYGRQVEVIILKGNYTKSFISNFNKIKDLGIKYKELSKPKDIDLLKWEEESILIDALFGTGLNRPLDGIAALLVQKINTSKAYKIAIDLPSGLSADCIFKSTPENTIKANFTLSIQLPKLAFLFTDNSPYVGNFECVAIGLSQEFITQTASSYNYITPNDISAFVKPRNRDGYKGSFGHALIIAGSEGKGGAALLASKAALRSGCGLVTVCIPKSIVAPLLSQLPEAMSISGTEELRFKKAALIKSDAVGFGPGLGFTKSCAAILLTYLKRKEKLLVIDADGLTLLSRNKLWCKFLNPNIILTPHAGEFDRLTHPHDSGYSRFLTQVEFSKKYNVFVLLKGHHTSITSPTGLVHFNSTGNNGMATAGSGDVLTGMITSLLSQGYSPLEATVMGAYLHGYAGDAAALKHTKTSLIASDIIEGIQAFFMKFER